MTDLAEDISPEERAQIVADLRDILEADPALHLHVVRWLSEKARILRARSSVPEPQAPAGLSESESSAIVATEDAC